MITISVEFPSGSILARRAVGGGRASVTALEENLRTAGDDVVRSYVDAIKDAQAETVELAVLELKKEIGGLESEIRKRIKLERVTRFKLRGRIGISAKRIPLKLFSATQESKGVRVRVGGRSKFYRSAFGPNIPRLGRNVFQRVASSRLPIRKARGISLVTVAKKSGLDDKLRTFLQVRSRVLIKAYMTADVWGFEREKPPIHVID